MYQYGTKEWEEAYRKLIEERKRLETRPYLLPTPEWVAEFETKIQQDDRYKELAKKWEGSVCLIFTPKLDPENPEIIGLKENIYIYMDLEHGKCHFAKLVPPEIGKQADYPLKAEYWRWKKILKRELNVVTQIATRKLPLVLFDADGKEFDLTEAKTEYGAKYGKLIAAAGPALRLVDLAAMVGARFLDELTPEELEKTREFFRKLKEDFGI